MANNSESVEITSQGIKKVLKKYKPEQAFHSITEFSVKDNGDGIVYEELPVFFKNFYESHERRGDRYRPGGSDFGL